MGSVAMSSCLVIFWNCQQKKKKKKKNTTGEGTEGLKPVLLAQNLTHRWKQLQTLTKDQTNERTNRKQSGQPLA